MILPTVPDVDDNLREVRPFSLLSSVPVGPRCPQYWSSLSACRPLGRLRSWFVPALVLVSLWSLNLALVVCCLRTALAAATAAAGSGRRRGLRLVKRERWQRFGQSPAHRAAAERARGSGSSSGRGRQTQAGRCSAGRCRHEWSRVSSSGRRRQRTARQARQDGARGLLAPFPCVRCVLLSLNLDCHSTRLGCNNGSRGHKRRFILMNIMAPSLRIHSLPHDATNIKQ